jgi:hypothetical protein
MKEQKTYDAAKRTVEVKIGFYIHLVVYVAVNILLVAINLKTTPEHYWFLWPLFGWGLGIFFHALGVYVFGPGSRVKDRMIEREAQK